MFVQGAHNHIDLIAMSIPKTALHTHTLALAHKGFPTFHLVKMTTPVIVIPCEKSKKIMTDFFV